MKTPTQRQGLSSLSFLVPHIWKIPQTKCSHPQIYESWTQICPHSMIFPCLFEEPWRTAPPLRFPKIRPPCCSASSGCSQSRHLCGGCLDHASVKLFNVQVCSILLWTSVNTRILVTLWATFWFNIHSLDFFGSTKNRQQKHLIYFLCIFFWFNKIPQKSRENSGVFGCFPRDARITEIILGTRRVNSYR